VKDEPVKDLLGNINKSLIQRLLERKYGGDVSTVPVIDYLAVEPKAVPETLSGVVRTQNGSTVTFEFGSALPQTSAWLETLAGQKLGWLRALVTSTTIVQGTSYIDNPLRRILAPRVGQKVVVQYTGSLATSVVIYGAARSYGEHIEDFKAVEITYAPETSHINVSLIEERRGSSIPLVLQFVYKPSQGYAPIHEIATDRNTRIKAFYWKLWYGDNEVLPSINIRDKFVGPSVVIKAEDVEQFCAVVGNQAESYKTARNETVQAPMDFAIVTGWQVRFKTFLLWFSQS
jgi:fatty acid synthase subunit alpha